MQFKYLLRSLVPLLMLVLINPNLRAENTNEEMIGDVTEVLVIKSAHKLVLLIDDEPVEEFEIALGFAPEGHKTQQGDGKTPEGRYTLDWRNPQSKFYKSLHVSYPNKADKDSAKQRGVSPGGDIMIHGLPNGWGWVPWSVAKQMTTEGCIAVRNPDMDIIWRRVKNGTPITIKP